MHAVENWTVKLVRGPLPSVVYQNVTMGRALSRADSLCYLHTCQQTRSGTEITVDASAYYAKAKPGVRRAESGNV